jgi:multisubunit Na+/H+ antiporter MnhB subunit
MRDVLLIVAVVGGIAFFAATIHVYILLWRYTREQWRRSPPEHRRRSARASVIVGTVLVAMLVLTVAAPWGRNSIIYVIAVYGGVLITASMVSVVVRVVRETRRSRERRRERARTSPS